MSNEDILTKAIEKAIAGGFKTNWYRQRFDKSEWIWTQDEQYGTIIEAEGLKDLIFNHDFAKALWGEAIDTFVEFDGDDLSHFTPTWQYHLQQMVIADDPIAYLGENL